MKKLLYILRSLFSRFRKKTDHLYDTLDTETQKLVHLSVHIVQAMKTITIDTQVDDVIVAILTKLYPKFGSVVTAFMLRLEAWIPKWLEELHVAQTILDNKDKNDRILAIITALNLSPTKSEEYLQFASKCLYYLDGGDDGKLNWEDCKAIVGEYYDGYVKK